MEVALGVAATSSESFVGVCALAVEIAVVDSAAEVAAPAVEKAVRVTDLVTYRRKPLYELSILLK